MKILILLVVFVIFVIVLISNRVILRRVRQRMDKSQKTADMMLKALEISANEVVRYDVSERYIHKLYGHLTPDEGLSLEEWMKHVHPDDQEEALDWFRQILYNRLKRAEFRYRWNFDYTGRSPRWGHIYNVSVPEYVAGSGRIGSIISTMKDETDLIRQEEEESELTDRYKLIYENSIIGLSFYTPDGWLLDSNKLMREICHFDSEEGDQFFSNTNMFELSPFRECCDPNNLQELWICTQSVVPERNIYDYLEIRLRPIYDDAGVLNYIAIAARNVTEERQMYLQAKLNDIQIQKANAKIKAYEEELRYMMEACDMCVWRLSFAEGTVKFYKGLSTIEREIPFAEMADYFIDAKENVMRHFTVDQDDYFGKPLSYLGRMRPILHAADEVQWNQMNSIPVFDGEGRLTGAFGLIRNITGLMKKQEMLKQETERANDSGRLKSVFLANMTHEIRTPLNAIVGFSDLLPVVEDHSERMEFIRIIRNNCDMLMRLINDILEASNVGQALAIQPEQVDFAKVFDDICQTLAQRVDEAGVQFIKDNPYDTFPATLDKGRIQQVLTNFTTNAIKYTHEGHIKVGYREQEGGIYFYCEDTGAGIPKDKQAAVFERFVKLNDFVQGTGLGLSICKAIAERCDGKIGVMSEGEGHGSTFWMWIPRI